jgi:transketolase
MKQGMAYLPLERMPEKANEIRNLTLDMCCRLGTGHITSGFSCTELLVALYYGDILQYDPQRPAWAERDRFILSKGHASTALYPVLADVGYFPREELQNCLGTDALLGLLLRKDVPGAEISSGSLGMGLGIAAGLAYALRADRSPSMVFCMLGDGECHEGGIWESALFASHNHLNNLVAIVDRNYLCASDFTENILALEPFTEKWEAFGWHTKRINGHSFPEILAALDNVHSRKDHRPLMIIADTVKGKGVDFIANVPLMHGAAPQGEDVSRARQCLNCERTVTL